MSSNTSVNGLIINAKAGAVTPMPNERIWGDLAPLMKAIKASVGLPLVVRLLPNGAPVKAVEKEVGEMGLREFIRLHHLAETLKSEQIEGVIEALCNDDPDVWDRGWVAYSGDEQPIYTIARF